MYRYLALTWNPHNEQAVAVVAMIASQQKKQSLQWESAYNSPALTVFHTDMHEGRMQAYPIVGHDGQCGVIVGKLFRKPAWIRAPIASNVSLTAAQSRRILKTCGQELVDHYWGSYIAFVNDHSNRRRWVFRDPIGCLSCHCITYKDVEIYFSDLETIANYEFLDLSLDWGAIAIYAKYLFPGGSSTCFRNITELSPGERLLTTQHNRSTDSLWDPCKIVKSDGIKDADEAAQLLRAVTKNCVAAWAGNYDNILLRIGGLDSSIVLACLSQMEQRPEITCLNYYTTQALDGDERVYVRMATKRAGVPLVEQERSISAINVGLLNRIRRDPTPKNDYWHAIELSQFEMDLARKTGAGATFSGIGGDQVFFVAINNYGASDYVKKYGLRPRLLKYALEAAQIQNISFWSALKVAVKDGFADTPFSIITEKNKHFYDTTTLNHKLITRLESSKELFHDPLRNVCDIGHGKIRQIYSLRTAPDYNGIFLPPNHIDPIAPLFSQPVVELTLRIPSWILAKGGVKRGLARYAFAKDVPKEIICRESKASAQNYYQQLLGKNRTFFKAFLLDGHLAGKSLLNGAVVKNCLSHNQADAEISRILSHICLEAWVKRNV